MKPEDFWYPFFVVAYRRDTRHLSLDQDAAYRRLIDEYMETREALPNNDEALARIIGIPKTEWDRLAPVVRRFFRVRNDKLLHKRCELELRSQNARHNRYRERASKGGKAKAFKDKALRAFSTLNPATRHNNKNLTTTEYVDKGPSEDDGSESPAVVAFRARTQARKRG